MPESEQQAPKSTNRLIDYFQRLYQRAIVLWNYASAGVWHDTRPIFRVRLIKTLNLTVRSFMNSDLQSSACAMTYRTLLAIVPAMALAFAICRGFGFQNLFSEQLYRTFPSQHQLVETSLRFVDSYLAQTSEGVFVGIGILFLLWTLISLLGNVEDSFNRIWQVEGRTLSRKVTDYLAILMILPVLMICAGGLSILMSTTLKTLLPFGFLGPVVNLMLDAASLVLTWLFFAGAYMMIPNAKVKFLNAFIAGAVVGTSFQVIQWLFLSGQLYVAKYNAIYGSFSFLPLFLLWLQLTWLITLIGALVCYSSQNAGHFDFYKDVDAISSDYYRQVMITVMAVIAKRFVLNFPPISIKQLAHSYKIPPSLTLNIVTRLHKVGLIDYVERPDQGRYKLLLPAIDVNQLTVGDLINKMQTYGASNFIPGFDTRYAAVKKMTSAIIEAMSNVVGSTGITQVNIPVTIEDDISQSKISEGDDAHSITS